ncbi:MAG: hypothetical protein WCK65_03235 [Rhodospirillaceae bacterium]
MLKSWVAVMVVMLPISAFAQSQPAQQTAADADAGGLGRTLVLTAGVIGGVVVADILTGGTLTGPLLSAVGLRPAAPIAAAAVRAPLSPAIAEARAAGAVLGEQILAATEARDIAARKDMLYAAVIGMGGLAGGLLANNLSR